MWIETTKNGKVKYCDRVKDISGKLRKITVTMDKKSKRNEDIAREILRNKAQDLMYVVDNNITFFEGLDIIAEKYFNNKKENTKYGHKIIISLIKTKGYDIKLDLINSRYVKEIVELTTKTDKYHNEILKKMKSYIKILYKLDYIKDISFLDKLELKKIVYEEKKKYLEQEEVDKLLEELELYPRYRNLIEFLVNTGLRIGECLALTFDDLEGDILDINKSLDRFNNLNTVKTPSSRRKISLNKRCLEIIKSQRTINNNLTLTSPTFANKDNVIFFSDKGTHQWKENVRRFLIKNTTVNFNLHMLRHTHASLCIDKGVDVELISKRLGHVNSNVTREIYIHKTKKQQEIEFDTFKKIEF
jgi:integrase family protein